MCPESLQLSRQCVAQSVEGREDFVRQSLAQMPEELLRRVQLRRVRRQRQRYDLLRSRHFVTAMTARSIQHDADPFLRPFLPHRREEEIEADRVDMR